MATINVNLFALQSAQGDLPDSAFADKIGIDRTMLWRIKTGRNKPGQEFIAKFLNAFPDKKFEDVFFLDSVSHGIQAK